MTKRRRPKAGAVAAGGTTRPQGSEPPESRWFVIISLAFLATFVLAQHGRALLAPFHADDLLFLKKTWHAPIRVVWEPRELAFHYYRPWSRELHYWVIQRLFGASELPFHFVSFGLWLAILGLYIALVRRIAGMPAAAIAAAGIATLASWSVLLTWVAGVQDLWMLAFALASLLALSVGRMAWSTLFCALALLSKETAAVLPIVAVSYGVAVDRCPVSGALRRTAPMWLLTVAWAAFHPLLGGRLWHPIAEPPIRGLHSSLLLIVSRTLLSLLNLDEQPKPRFGWVIALQGSVGGIVSLCALVLWACFWLNRHSHTALTGAQAPTRSAALGTTWALAGWLPLLSPSVGWHAYYGLFGAFGAWLVLGVWLASRRWAAVALIGLLTFARGARTDRKSVV